MQDVIWVGLAVAFYLFSAWFVGFSDRLMPAVRRADAESADGRLPNDGERQATP